MKNYRHIEELKVSFTTKKDAIRVRLKEYGEVPQEKYFYELLYYLMTPQSSAVNAGKAQKDFESLDYRHTNADPEPVLFQKDHYIRFHRSKARWIEAMKKNYDTIMQVTVGPMSAEEKREWFVKNVIGLSYKEATHFLRNIGKNDGLAILDRHIVKNLKYHGVIRSLPLSLNKKRYLSIEKKFQTFAGEIGLSIDELDLLFWSNEAGEILK
ncbi:MAG: DNA lyase [Bacteroidota bacterium]